VGSSLSGERDYDLGLPEVKGESKGESAMYANMYGAGAGGSGSRKADCLVLDLDGTLLNRDCVITPRTAEALRECAAAGVTVFIATGKARPAAIRAAATAGLDGVGGVVSRKSPGVFIQGLDVYGINGDPLYKAEMPTDVVREAFDLIYGGGLDTRVALTAFCGDECATLSSHALLDELTSLYHEPKSVPWDDVATLVRAARAAFGGNATASGVQKLLLMAESAAEIDACRPRWESLFGGRCEVTQAVPNMLEILPLGNDKARGVRTLLTHLDVDVSRVVAVGDGENDLGMLKMVGCGVAMGNAGAVVKAAAKETLECTNETDGVAEAIERFVL
jgi:Cof subfamily protein (haloacid dehalogenase superfamily)